jgi:hypothetical protein
MEAEYVKIERKEERKARGAYAGVIPKVWETVGKYIQPIDQLHNAISGEMDSDGKFILIIEPVEMTEEEYKNLPEFTGY